MAEELKYRNILYDDRQIGKYPTDKLKRVEKPTTEYSLPVDEWERKSERDAAMYRCATGMCGEEIQKLAPMVTQKEPIGATLISVQMNIANMRQNEPAPKIAPIPQDPRVLARHIKSFVYFSGADIVGICKLPQSSVYSESMEGDPIEAPYKYAIVMLYRKDANTYRASSGYDWIIDGCSFNAYQKLGIISETTANYIRRLGYEAAPSYMFSYLTLMPQLILEAGLGESARCGSVVNPFLGFNFKSSAVLTNMPLEVDKPIDFGMQEYCNNCTICAECCPVQCIEYGDKTEYNGYVTWHLTDKESCWENAIKDCVCGRCGKVCPWSNYDNGPEAFADWDGSNEWLKERADKRKEFLIANNYHDPEEYTDKWWFDLIKDSKDGDLYVPDKHFY
jgi:ferredoxin